jgi:hypothetical protein
MCERGVAPLSHAPTNRGDDMFAQSLGEYGAIGSLASGVQQVVYSISTWLGSLSATTWIIAAAVVLGLVVFMRR